MPLARPKMGSSTVARSPSRRASCPGWLVASASRYTSDRGPRRLEGSPRSLDAAPDEFAPSSIATQDTTHYPVPVALFDHVPDRVSVYEVSLRDGLQNERATVPLRGKLRLIDALV